MTVSPCTHVVWLFGAAAACMLAVPGARAAEAAPRKTRMLVWHPNNDYSVGENWVGGGGPTKDSYAAVSFPADVAAFNGNTGATIRMDEDVRLSGVDFGLHVTLDLVRA